MKRSIYYIRMYILFTREFPGTGCKGHNDAEGLLACRCFARRTAIEDEPTPAPLV
jgi:hypothetical protein